jgi:glycosyltransferase involved in cell wall biosynthesis
MNDWGLYGRTYEMIARHLGSVQGVDRVLCILPPRMIWHGYYLLPFHLKVESKKLLLLTPNLRMIPKSFIPPTWREYVNEHIRDAVIRISARLFGFSKRNTILWLFPPHRYINRLLDMVPHRMLVTQIIDNHVDKSNEGVMTKTFSERQYNELAMRSNVVITSSRQNFERYSFLNANCYNFENAIDERFLVPPSEMPFRKGGARPRLGYVGWISQRTNLDLIAYVAKERPLYDIIIAGPHEHGMNLEEYGLNRLSNVHIEKAVPYESVPDFLATLDVCLIPHRDTSYSRSMNPLKVFQYLASGRPIVSTPVAGVERWDGMISVARNDQEFLEKIDSAIRNDGLSDSVRRIEAVRLDTWGIRIRQIFDVLSKHMTKTEMSVLQNN